MDSGIWGYWQTQHMQIVVIHMWQGAKPTMAFNTIAENECSIFYTSPVDLACVVSVFSFLLLLLGHLLAKLGLMV